ncbi:MAG TPA: ATP-binding cassette domain-containing protein [Galbitalea sp.]
MHGLDLRIDPGERVLLLGASGAGKSTLVHALAGVLGGEDDGDEHGRLLVAGEPAIRPRGRVGLVLQDPDSQVVLSRVGDDVAFGCENLGVPREETWRRVRHALDAVGLDLRLDHPTGSLSGGQKQRLALAGVLAMQPGLLLLDEPTANLDPAGVREVRDAVASVLDESGATFIVIEHRVDVWLDVIDRVIVLEPAGGVLADGPAREVLERQGEQLAASGVWVPGRTPPSPNRSRVAGGGILSTTGLSVGRGRAAIQQGVGLELRAGRSLAITGPNGVGKTTLGLTLAGLIPPLAGSVDAAPLARGLSPSPIAWRSRELVTRIGSVFQDPEHQFVAPTVRDELGVGPQAAKMPEVAAGRRIDEVAARLRLTRLMDANPFTLSGGEKRRLSVATALVTAPPLMVLDEPTFGQDSRTWAELVALLAELLDTGTSIVSITHDAAFIDAIADSTFELSKTALVTS